jgi:hypothetical protein
MKTVRFVSRAIAVSLVAVLPAFAAAGQTAQAPATVAVANTEVMRTMTHPLRVTNCNPSRNNYMASGYTPGFYPTYRGAYWGWPTVYGPAYTYYQYPVAGNPTLSIDYSNATDSVMKDIEFGLVANGRLVAEVRDVGTFSPGAEIKHEFGLSPNVFPLQTSIVHCIPLRIVFADGSRWKNPHLPALNRGIYGHHHDSM